MGGARIFSDNSNVKRRRFKPAALTAAFACLIALHAAPAFSEMPESLGAPFISGRAYFRTGNSHVVELLPGTHTLTVSGHKTVKAKPDLMIISFTVKDKTFAPAQCSKLQAHKTAEAAAAIKAKLGNKGTFETSGYSIHPETMYGPRPQVRMHPDWTFSQYIKATAGSVSDLVPIVKVALAAAPDVSVLNGGYDRPHRAASVGGKRERESKPPPFIMFVLYASGPTAEKAISVGTRNLGRVEAAIAKKLGKRGRVAPSASAPWWVQVDEVSGPARYGSTVTMTYYARTTLTVRTRHFDLLGPLIQAAIARGASEVRSVSFTMSDKSRVENEAIAAAVRTAERKARASARSVGLKLGKILSVSATARVRPVVLDGDRVLSAVEDSSERSLERAMRQLLPRQIGAKAKIKVVYEID
jgi:uncharacterized protein YggE